MERGRFDEIGRAVVEARRAFGALVYGGESGEVPLELMASAGRCYYGLTIAAEAFEKLLGLFSEAGPVLLLDVQGVQTCRECGCTDDRACWDALHEEPCHWVQADLCSCCAPAVLRPAPGLVPTKKKGYRVPRDVQRERAEAEAAPPIRRSRAEVAASRSRGHAKSARVRAAQAGIDVEARDPAPLKARAQKAAQARGKSDEKPGGRGQLKRAVRAAFAAHPGGCLGLKTICLWLATNERDAVKHLLKPSGAVYQCLLKLVAAGELIQGTEGKVQVWQSMDN